MNYIGFLGVYSYITGRDIPSRYYTSSFFGIMVIFGPSVSAVWSKFLAVRFLLWPSGFGLMDTPPFTGTLYQTRKKQMTQLCEQFI